MTGLGDPQAATTCTGQLAVGETSRQSDGKQITRPREAVEGNMIKQRAT